MIVGITMLCLTILGIGYVDQPAWANTPDEALESPSQTLTIHGCLAASQFEPVLDEFSTGSGITVYYTEGCDQDWISSCQKNTNCPDIAIMAQPGLLADLAQEGALVDLSLFINSTVLNTNYAEAWINLGKVDGTLYGVWFNASNKSLVWYDPGEFLAHAWTTPTTWTQMLSLSETISNTTSTPPWSIGNGSGTASGWPLTDWFENILLRSAGPDMYDDLVAHDIPWTHTEVISATTYFGEIFGNEAYQLGGKSGTLETHFIDAMYPPFEVDPGAYLHHQGSFTTNFLQDHFPTQVPGTDYAVYSFPDIDSAYTNACMGSGDVAMVFHDTSEAQSFINFLITTDAAELWINAGGISPNRSVDTSLYTEPNLKYAADKLANADIFRFDLTDQLPGSLYLYVWSQMDDLVQAAPDQAAMMEVLARIELMASDPYTVFLPNIVRQLLQ